MPRKRNNNMGIVGIDDKARLRLLVTGSIATCVVSGTCLMQEITSMFSVPYHQIYLQFGQFGIAEYPRPDVKDFSFRPLQ